jgi:hypothetical protein
VQAAPATCAGSAGLDAPVRAAAAPRTGASLVGERLPAGCNCAAGGRRCPMRRRSRESASPRFSESSPAERRARAATRWVRGALGSTARSLAAKSQTNLVLSVRPDSFGAKPHWRSSESLPGSRLLLLSWPGEAARPSVAVGGARAVPDCLASLRPSERNGAAAQLVKRTQSGVERRQSWRVSHRARAAQGGSGELANRGTWRKPKPVG